MLQAMGYTWNGRAWVRGDAKAYAQQKATSRSSNRYIRLVDSKDGTTPIATPSAVIAAKRLSDVLQRARSDAMPQRTKDQLARDRDFKNFVSKKEAPFIWLSAELAAFVALCQIHVSISSTATSIGINWEYELQQCMSHPISIISFGFLAGIILSISRTLQLIPGMEEPDGKLVRILADTMAEKNDAIALPAPNHVRYSNTKWNWLAFGGEVAAAVNVSILMNGILQPSIAQLPSILNAMSTEQMKWDTMMMMDDIRSPQIASSNTTDLMMAISLCALIALPAAIRSAYHYMPPLDGINAECKSLKQSKVNAGAYFNMNPNVAKAGADPLEATAIFQQLADGWLETYGGVAGKDDDEDNNNQIAWKQGLLAFGGSLACALSYQFSDQSLMAPLLARLLAAANHYLIQDRKESCRKSVKLHLSPSPNDTM